MKKSQQIAQKADQKHARMQSIPQSISETYIPI